MGLLGIDVGTTGCKATVLDYEGNVQGQAYSEYPPNISRTGRFEINPESTWDTVKKVISESLARYKGDKIKAVSVSSFGESVVPIGREGNVLSNSILYIDARGSEEAKFMENRMGRDKILEITGALAHPMYSLSKIMWMKKNLPEIYNRTWKFLLYADFILYKLGAVPHTDYSLAARTMAFDVINKRWSDEILDCAGIAVEKFGKPVQAGTIVGEINPGIAAELGLPTGVLLVAGGHDQPCAALGAGVIINNVAVDGMGTVECITPAFDRPVISKPMAEANLVCVPHVKKDMYVTYAFNFTSGSLLKWFRDRFGYEEKLEAQKAGVNVYEVLLEKASKIDTNLFLLPHFAGAATPYMDPDAKGAIIGLDINTTKADIVKAIMEGITFEMMVNLQHLEKAGVKVRELRTVGGLAQSRQMLQLKADMMGMKVVSLNVSEAGTLGVAILAGVAGGVYGSLEDAAKKLVKTREEFYPDQAKHAAYAEKFETYKRIYTGVRYIYGRDVKA